MEAEVIRISMSENEGIIELLRRMYELKTKENQDIECEYSGEILTTKECNTFEDLLIKNSNVVFGYLEKDKDFLLQSAEMQTVIEDFKVRGKKYDGSEVNPQAVAHDIWENTKKFENKLNEFETLDFSNSTKVYNWLNSIVEFVNDHDLHLALGLDKIEYKSATDYIVKKLEEKGYTNQLAPVNNLDDYYRRLISYQLDDLVKYEFFAYDYADSIRDNINSNIMDEVNNLDELQDQKKMIIRNLSVIADYEKGSINFKKENTESFEERKRKIQDKINELELANTNTEPVDINSVFLEADEKVKLLAMRTGKDKTKAMNFYEAAAGVPFTNNIIPALEQAAQLSDTDELKQPLIDALLKMDARYSSFKDDNDIKLVQDTLEKLGIQSLTTNTNAADEEISRLKNEIDAIDKEQKARIELQKPIKEKLYNQLNEINDKMVQKPEEKTVVNEVKEEIKEENQESFMDKLARIAEEGPVFVDLERRLDKNDQWMELNTASNLGKLDEQQIEPVVEPSIQEASITENEETVEVDMTEVEDKVSNEEMVEEAVDDIDYDSNEIEEVDEDVLTPKEDSLTIPHPIKAIKKASINLIQKVRGIEFNKVIKDALDWIKEHKKVSLAVATGLMIGASVMLGAELNDVEEVKASEDPTIESNQDDLNNQNSNDIVDNEVIENSQNTIDSEVVSEVAINEQNNTDNALNEQIAEEAIQNALNGILDGDKVYASAVDAINDTNALSTNESQRNNSWVNSEAGAFYDNNAEVLTREEAEEKIAAGEQVVVRYDNNGVPIGYAVGSLSNDDVSGLSR